MSHYASGEAGYPVVEHRICPTMTTFFCECEGWHLGDGKTYRYRASIPVLVAISRCGLQATWDFVHEIMDGDGQTQPDVDAAVCIWCGLEGAYASGFCVGAWRCLVRMQRGLSRWANEISIENATDDSDEWHRGIRGGSKAAEDAQDASTMLYRLLRIPQP